MLNKDRENLFELQKTKRICSYFNYVGVAICIWLFVYPEPYDYAVFTGAIYPLLMLIIFYLKRDTINFISMSTEVKSLMFPSISTALFMPLIGLVVRAMKDYRPLHFTDVFLPAFFVTIVLGVIFYLILMAAEEKVRTNPYTRFTAVAFVITYALVVPLPINCNFDYGKPKVYAARIVSQAVYENPKPAIYNLTLTKWGLSEGGETEVSKLLYNQVKKGDIVHVMVKPGLFKIPWFYVSR